MLKSRLPQIAAALPRRLEPALKAGAGIVANRAADRAPDAPPYGQGLVEAIHVEEEESGGFLVVAGDDDVFWGGFQEFGTSQHAPHPFLIPALEESRDHVVMLAQRALRSL